MAQEIIKELGSTTTELIEVLSSFTQQDINKIPFEGSWTAAQVGEHLSKAYIDTIEALHGEMMPTERNPDKNIGEIKNVFLNFDIKMKSPEFVAPEIKDYNKESLLNSLKNSKEKLNDAVKTLDLSETSVPFKFPDMGNLTRKEIIYFLIYHTQRHVHQLRNISQKLSDNSNS